MDDSDTVSIDMSDLTVPAGAAGPAVPARVGRRGAAPAKASAPQAGDNEFDLDGDVFDVDEDTSSTLKKDGGAQVPKPGAGAKPRRPSLSGKDEEERL